MERTAQIIEKEANQKFKAEKKKGHMDSSQKKENLSG